MRWVALWLLLAGCAPELDWRQRQAELIGRIVDRNASWDFEAVVTDRTSPLGAGRHDAQLELRHPWLAHLPQPLDVACFEGARAHGHHRREPPHCRLDLLPEFDARPDGPTAAELVAMVAPMGQALVYDLDNYRIRQRSLGDGGSRFVVHTRKNRVAFDVHCATKDPRQAPRRCRVQVVATPLELDEVAHAGVHVKSCGEAATAISVLEPDGAVGRMSLPDAQTLMREIAQVPHVHSVGYGACCPEVAQAVCLQAHLDLGADREPVAAAIADVLRATPGERLRVSLDSAGRVIEQHVDEHAGH